MLKTFLWIIAINRLFENDGGKLFISVYNIGKNRYVPNPGSIHLCSGIQYIIVI